MSRSTCTPRKPRKPRIPRDPNALDLRTPPKAHRSLRCQHWYLAARAVAGGYHPPIMQPPRHGGAGGVAVASAALFRLTLLTSEQRQAAVYEFDETVLMIEYAHAMKRYRGEYPHLPIDQIREKAFASLYWARPRCKIFAWVHRRLVRDSKAHNRDLIDWCSDWGGVALWLFLRLPAPEQWGLVKYVNQRQAEQIEVDALAFDAARRILAE